MTIKRVEIIKLDVGCGRSKAPGFVGMDYREGPGVDIVHDVCDVPWPIEVMSCSVVRMSHVIEHIPPERRFDVIDEAWRVLYPTGRLELACPHAGSVGAHAHLEHYACPNATAFHFFDPRFGLYHARQPSAKPWRLVESKKIDTGSLGCVLLVRMTPRKNADGEPVIERLAKPIYPIEFSMIDKTSHMISAETE